MSRRLPKGDDHSIVGPAIRRYVRVYNDEDERITDHFGSNDKFTSDVWPEDWAKPTMMDPGTVPAEKLGYFMSLELHRILWLRSYGEHYGIILYEGILDSIDIRVNGETRHCINMSEMLATARPWYWGSQEHEQPPRKERWGIWKSWVTERRKLCSEGTTTFSSRPDNLRNW